MTTEWRRGVLQMWSRGADGSAGNSTCTISDGGSCGGSSSGNNAGGSSSGSVGGYRRAFTSQDFLPEMQTLPYTLQSAIDFEVCRRASLFVGNSWSGFSTLIARRQHQAGRPSFIYNIDDVVDGKGRPVIVQRTDRGISFEPHDATRSAGGS
jgi:hypothetical protein